MIPSQRLYTLLSLGMAIAFLLAIVVNLQLALTITMIWDVLILGIAVVDSLRVKPHRVEVQRYLIPKLSIGRDNQVILSVTSKNKPVLCMVRDYYPLEFAVSPPQFQVTLKPNSVEELIYTVHPYSRGEYSWGDIQIRQLSGWGLAWYDWKIPASEKVPVYPDLVGLRSLSIRLSLENTGTMRQARRLGRGTEFAELREYRRGDDTRTIDWKATARKTIPVVRVLEPEQEQTLVILLDRGRLMKAQVKGLKRFDWGLNCTLSLALAGLGRGDLVGVGVFDREIVSWIPPQRGKQHLSYIMETLTPIQPVLLEPDYLGVVSRLVNQQTRRALVVLITDIVDTTASTELLTALGRLTPRYLPFCVTLKDPQVDQMAYTPSHPPEIEAAYQRAVALDVLSQRQIAFAQLKQRGVYVLDAPANQMSDKLVDRYLQFKARNLL